LRAVRAEGAPPGLALEVVPPPGPVFASVDPDLLGAVFFNLARNSVEAMGDTGRISVSLRTDEGNGRSDALVVRLEDTGPGIPEESREAIFRPFFTTKERGSGLGLAISRRIVGAHGGALGCGQGAGGG